MYSITKNGKPLDKSLYTIDEKTKTFSSNVDGLVLDFSDEYGWTFDTSSYCTFDTSSYCTFNTGSDCIFKTGFGCTFNTGSGCTFKTNYGCTFNTGSDCTFKTNYDCNFKTSSYCTFDTGSDCIFKTGFGCTFNTGSGCTFKTNYDCTFDTGVECVVVRRDIYEVIELDGTKKIKLNKFNIKGFTVINEESETIQIGNQKYNKKEVEEALKNIKSL